MFIKNYAIKKRRSSILLFYVCISSKVVIGLRFYSAFCSSKIQDCDPEAPGCHRHLTFPFELLVGKTYFFNKSFSAGHPGFDATHILKPRTALLKSECCLETPTFCRVAQLLRLCVVHQYPFSLLAKEKHCESKLSCDMDMSMIRFQRRRQRKLKFYTTTLLRHWL